VGLVRLHAGLFVTKFVTNPSCEPTGLRLPGSVWWLMSTGSTGRASRNTRSAPRRL